MFSVVVVDYEPSVSRQLFRRKMACLADQTCKDFEVLVYHDGPKAQSYADDLSGAAFHPQTQFIVTEARAGDWGHSNRDLGIRAARGRWIIHTNADNVFYPNLIATLKGVIEDPERWSFARLPRPFYPRGLRWIRPLLERHLGPDPSKAEVVTNLDPQGLIYGITLRGMVPVGQGTVRVPEMAHRQGILLSGYPVKVGYIDAMQMVLRRDIWLAEGGWYNRENTSDGQMYSVFASKYRVLPVPEVLGEHW